MIFFTTMLPTCDVMQLLRNLGSLEVLRRVEGVHMFGRRVAPEMQFQYVNTDTDCSKRLVILSSIY